MTTAEAYAKLKPPKPPARPPSCASAPPQLQKAVTDGC